MTKQRIGLTPILVYGKMNHKMDIRTRQRDTTDCGAACLASVSKYYRLNVPVARIRHKAGTDKKGTNMLGMAEAAKSLGFEAKGVRGPFESLFNIPLPAIAHLIVNGTLHHYVVISSVSRNYIEIMDPADGQLYKKTHEQFKIEWTGVLLLLVPSADFVAIDARKTIVSRLFTLLKPHRNILFQALFGAIIYTILGLSTSIFIQKIVDHVLVESNYKLLNLMSIAMIILLLLRVFIGTFKNIFIMRTGQMIDARLILGYYQHLLKLPQQFFDSMRVGEITSRISDAVKIRVFINDVAINLLVNFFMLAFSLALMFTYYWKLGLIMCLVVPFYSVIYYVTNQLNKKVQRKLMEDGAELESQLVESLNAIGTIKRFALEDHANRKTEVRFISLLKTVYQSGINSLFSGNSAEFVSQIFTIILLWVGAGFVLDKQISPGELLSFYTLIGYFTVPVSSFIGMNKVVQDAIIAADRLFEIMDLEREMENEDNKIELSVKHLGDIIFSDITFRYGTRTEVFKNLNLTIPLGKLTGVVGESGSGKSTLMALLHNVYPLTSGNIFIGDYSLKYIGNKSLRTIIGVVPQQTDLFSGSLISNIALGDDDINMQKILKICTRLGITGFVESLPEGFETNIGENGVTLSGGQKQRIAIARVLYREPEILILDEATSSLDPISEQYVQEAIMDFISLGKTVIVIAHRLSTIQKANKIIVLKNGKLAEEGTHSELLMLKSEYHYLWTQHMPLDFSSNETT